MTRADIARNSENVCGKPRPLLHTAISTTTPKAGSKQKDQKDQKMRATKGWRSHDGMLPVNTAGNP